MPPHKHRDSTVCYEILYHLPKKQAKALLEKIGEEKIFARAFEIALQAQAEQSTCFEEAVTQATWEALKETFSPYS